MVHLGRVQASYKTNNMIKKVVIKNGKKYIVNAPSYGDVGGTDYGVADWFSSQSATLTAGFTSSFVSSTGSFVNTTIYTGTGLVTYSFDFGDGSPITASANVTHIYATGSYTASLSATASAGTLSSSYSFPFSIDPYDGILYFSGSSLTITNQEILDTYAGSINQAGQSWKEIHGHNLTNLTTLYCYSNLLSTLDVSTNTALTYLDCSSNILSTLDVSTNTALTTLYCYSNTLSTLDVSTNTDLTTLDCSSNTLIELSVDTILHDLVTNGQLGGYVDLSGGINSAPSAAGVASGSILSGDLNWTVITN